jgi:hypothetical protein
MKHNIYKCTKCTRTWRLEGWNASDELIQRGESIKADSNRLQDNLIIAWIGFDLHGLDWTPPGAIIALTKGLTMDREAIIAILSSVAVVMCTNTMARGDSRRRSHIKENHMQDGPRPLKPSTYRKTPRENALHERRLDSWQISVSATRGSNESVTECRVLHAQDLLSRGPQCLNNCFEVCTAGSTITTMMRPGIQGTDRYRITSPAESSVADNPVHNIWLMNSSRIILAVAGPGIWQFLGLGFEPSYVIFQNAAEVERSKAALKLSSFPVIDSTSLASRDTSSMWCSWKCERCAVSGFRWFAALPL